MAFRLEGYLVWQEFAEPLHNQQVPAVIDLYHCHRVQRHHTESHRIGELPRSLLVSLGPR
jgi:hypothetical protein